MKFHFAAVFFLLSLCSFSLQAGECKQEGYQLEIAEKFLWILKGKNIQVNNEQYKTVYDLYQTVLLDYEVCTKNAISKDKEQ